LGTFLISERKIVSLWQQHTTVYRVTTGLVILAATDNPLPLLMEEVIYTAALLYSGKISLPHLPETVTLSSAAMMATFLR
jgi:hypothetical protein